MMSLRRIFGLMLLFLFFETVVAVVTIFVFSPAYVLEACLAMTGLAVLIWVVFVVLSRVLSRERAPKTAPKVFVPAVTKPPADDSFTLEFTELMNEANRRLAGLGTSSSGKTVSTVQTLPMYLVIGQEGSGKTTAIVNCGLEPRLLAGEAQKDGQVVPTRLANFWYAERVVFVEIAGRVLMQEQDGWEKVLRVLASPQTLPKWRRLSGSTVTGSNLRGVLLACDIGTLMQTSDTHRLGAEARTLNERLQTVQRLMRADFPTYVLLTRCDSVRYFQEFFSQISDAEARRVLGVTLPAVNIGNEYADSYSDREGSRLAKFLNRLYQSLADKRMLLLAREEVTDNRALAYEFPRELKKIRVELVQFLLDVFRPSTLHAPCRLRGFYFSGRRLVPRGNVATVDGTSLDYSVVKRPSEATAFFHSVGRSSTLDYSMVTREPADKRVAKQAFLIDLFRDILPADSMGRAAVVAPRFEDSRYFNAALTACSLGLLMLSVLWVFAWKNNYQLLKEVDAAVRSTSVSPTAQPIGNLLSQLETVRPEVMTLNDNRRNGASLSYRWGMYAGNRVVDDLNSLYYTRFRQTVLDTTLGQMSGHFLTLSADAPVSEDVYKELKAYRTMSSGKCKPDEALVASMVMQVWDGIAANGLENEVLTEKQVQFYASELKFGDPYAGRIPENEEAVAQAQVYLRNLSGPDKILQVLLNQVRDKPAERLSGYASNYSQVLTGPDQMDGPYTRAGWQAVGESIREHKAVTNGEECVVGDNKTKVSLEGDATMDSQVQKLYSDTYEQSWKQYLLSHHVLPFTGTTDAAQKLRTLADNNRSPLLALVYMTSVNTNVAPMQNVRDQAKEQVIKVANGAATTIGNVATKFGISPKGVTTPGAVQVVSAPTVAGAFDPVHTMVDPGDPNKWLNEKNQPYMKALGDLGAALQALPSTVHVDVLLETQALTQAQTTLLAADSALHSLAANFPNTSSGVDVDLENLLREPIDQARRTVSSVSVVRPPAIIAGGPAVPGVPSTAPDPKAALKVKATIAQVNVSAVSLCSAASVLQRKFPFDATSTTDVSLDELNGLLQPGPGVYSEFANSPDVSKTFNHTGRLWAAKDFPATYSQTFMTTLNNFGQAEDEMYGGGSVMPHVDLTLTVDGTGKIPFEVDVDGHTIKFKPGKTTPPVRLVWPPVTSAATRLVLETGGKNPGGTAQYPGVWGLFHLLQAADDQNGNVFTFRSVRFANSLNPLTNEKGGPATVQIRIDSAASDLFGKGYFARLRCSDTWALKGEGSGN
jgi:type VI protein secretion system component VasK